MEAREGIPLTRDSFHFADSIISSGIKRGQYLHHIIQTHDLEMSKSAVQRNLHKGY